MKLFILIFIFLPIVCIAQNLDQYLSTGDIRYVSKNVAAFKQTKYEAVIVNGKNKTGKKLETINYIFDQYGNLISKSVNDSFIVQSKILYDVKGNLIEADPDNFEYYHIKKRSYDDKGNLITLKNYDLKGNFEYGHEFTYNSKQKVIADKFINKENQATKYIYNYDFKENNTEAFQFDSMDKLLTHWKFYYDSLNRKIQEITYLKNDKDSFITYNKYDDNNKIIEITSFNKNNRFKKECFKYDAAGNQIEKVDFDADDKVKQKTVIGLNNNLRKEDTYSYDKLGVIKLHWYKEWRFDKKGNWIYNLQCKYDKPEFIFIREIKYRD